MTLTTNKSSTGKISIRPQPTEELIPYHTKKERCQRNLTGRFIAWDGEGVNLQGADRKQSYVLFGCSTLEHITLDLTQSLTLTAVELFDFMLGVASRNPGAFHVGYSFTYDSNMIVQTLPERCLGELHQRGHTYLFLSPGVRYYIEVRSGKWFRVSRQENGKSVASITIQDLFAFFACSFLKAYTQLIGTPPEIVSAGKASRNEFSLEKSEEIYRYWCAEIVLIEQLADALRLNLYGAGIFVTQWYGPGALANYTLKRNSIAQHMSESPHVIQVASQYAYAGGRFEPFRVGRIVRPNGIFAIDINSAYPHAISKLPSLCDGRWIPSTNPTGPYTFGVYQVRLHPVVSADYFRSPGPLFHRDKMDRISYPNQTIGWYWGPEVWQAMKTHSAQMEIVQGWEFVPSSKQEPFAWVSDVYLKRLEWKSAGNPSQLALKLMLNSLYGKMAQRVGWDQLTGKAPKWHQLEWAGWVTSLTRASIYSVISQLKYDSLVSVETDAIYSTDPSVQNLVTIGDGLGEWGLDVYDEVVYVQSGMAWLRKGEKWVSKRRGLDAHTFSLSDAMEHCRSMEPGRVWQPYTGETTRFITLGTALASTIPTKVHHCRWVTARKEIAIGHSGKRRHAPRFGMCQACDEGLTAYEMAHELIISSEVGKCPESQPHKIPWSTLGDYEPEEYIHNG